MWGMPAVAEASVTLQQPEAWRVFSQGSCPWVMGPWQACCTGSQRGVGNDLFLHTGFLVAVVAVVAVCACLWGPR